MAANLFFLNERELREFRAQTVFIRENPWLMLVMKQIYTGMLP